MLAFMRDGPHIHGARTDLLKLLPDGKPVQPAPDHGWKMGLQFSPDGSQIAYTVGPNTWETWTVPVLGSEPHLFLPNAAGLTWIDKGHVLFSRGHVNVPAFAAAIGSGHPRHVDAVLDLRETCERPINVPA
jgi:hypothetical protein